MSRWHVWHVRMLKRNDVESINSKTNLFSFSLFSTCQRQTDDFLVLFEEYLTYVSMSNVVSNVPFDKICYYTLDIHNFVDPDGTAYVSRNKRFQFIFFNSTWSILLLISRNFCNCKGTNYTEIYWSDLNGCKYDFENPKLIISSSSCKIQR